MATSRVEHLDAEALRRLVHGKASPDETRRVVRHLLAGCPSCGRLAAEAQRGPDDAAALDYDEVFERLEKRLVDQTARGRRQRATAHQLYAELLRHQAVSGLAQVHSTRRFASLALCELLLERSRARLRDQPARALATAGLAAAVAEQLDLEIYGSAVVQDLRSIAWCYFADAERIQADLRTAESVHGHAGFLLEEAACGPAERAELIALQAAMRSYQGRFEEAAQHLSRVVSIYRKLGDRHLLGRALLRKGTAFGNAGEVEKAVRLIRDGIDGIDPLREPHLMVAATHSYIWFANESGRNGQAAACIERARGLYQRATDRPDLARLRWLEGRIAQSLERIGDAEEALSAGRDELARLGLGYEAALASMDLAIFYAAQRKGPEMRRQAEAILPLFRSEDMYRETLVALTSLRGPEAPADEQPEIGDYLRRARAERNPPALAAAALDRGLSHPSTPPL